MRFTLAVIFSYVIPLPDPELFHDLESQDSLTNNEDSTPFELMVYRVDSSKFFLSQEVSSSKKLLMSLSLSL